MRGQGIYGAFTGSIFLHALLITASIIAVRHSGFKRLPASYIVSLVSAPSTTVSPSGEANSPDAVKTKAETKEPQAVKPKMQPPPPQKATVNKDDERLVSERIAALKAKKQIEKSAGLRKMIEIDSQKPAGARPGTARTGQPAAQKVNAGAPNTGGGDYDSMVTEKIRQQWIFPESIDRDLEAIVSIKVAKDGSLTIQKIEKSSGSPLFDRTVLRAVAKAGPLPQPPKEMEIVVRFRP